MPETKLLLPKFLTKETAEEAILVAAKTVLTPPISLDIKRQDFHIVVLVPKMVVEAGNYPNYPINPHLLAEYSQGDKKLWSRDYANIAQCKAIQRWYDRADGGTDTRPHLLFQGDTPYWGSVKRYGVVVACSGVQPYFDRMIAGIAADVMIGLAYHAWMGSLDKVNGSDFLT